MTNEELKIIIENLDQEELKRSGFFGIYQSRGDTEECFVRANREGLQLFALELLRAAGNAESMLPASDKSIVPLNYEEAWMDPDSQVVIHYIEPIAEKRPVPHVVPHKSTFAEKLVLLGCGLVALLLVISVITGLFVIFKWIF